MKRANWMYFVATALVLTTGVSVAGAKARRDSAAGMAEQKEKSHGRWARDVQVTTTTAAPTTTRPATTTTAAPTTTTRPVTTTTAVTTTTLAPPPPLPLPAGSFLSYPRQSAPLEVSGSNVVVANKSWVGFDDVALVVSNAHNVYLHDLDFEGNVGDIFLMNVTGQVRIENIRARNTGDGTIGSGHSNVIQLNNTWDNGTGGIRRVYAYGGNTEDAISVYKSGGIDATHPLIIEDVHVEHPLSGPLAWSSDSGTCINLADAGGHDIVVRYSTFLNCGAVGIQMNEPTRARAMNNIVYGAARPTSNVGLSQWSGDSCSACTGNEYGNNRVWWVKSSGSASAMWLSGNYPVADVGNVKQDTTINPAALHVAL